MNRWDCAAPGCTTHAIGAGGAIGLCAIGWWFAPGDPLPNVTPGKVFCPRHRPDPIPCTGEGADNYGQACPSCRADEVADVIQHAIAQHYEQLVAWDAERRLAGKRVQELP